jgi:uncharacterized RDD family membrane protein YckC
LIGRYSPHEDLMTNDPHWYAPPQADAYALSEASEASSAEFAGFSIRAGARILDVFVVAGLGAVAGMVGAMVLVQLARAGVVSAGWQLRIKGLSAGSFAFALVSSLLYHGLSEGLGGASVGKAVLGLRVKRERTLVPCGVGAAIVRNLAYFIDALICGVVAFAVMSHSPWNQRLGDKWAGTVVVRATSLPSNARGGVAFGLAAGSLALIAVGTLSMVLRGF